MTSTKQAGRRIQVIPSKPRLCSCAARRGMGADMTGPGDPADLRRKRTEMKRKLTEQEMERCLHYLELEAEGRLYELPVPLGSVVYEVRTCSCPAGFVCENGEKKNIKGHKPVECICMTSDDIGRKCRKVFEVKFEPGMLDQMGRGIFADREKAVEYARRERRWG